MDDPVRCLPAELLARDALDRLGAPEGSDVGKDLCGAGEQVPKEHTRRVQVVVFRREDVRLSDSVPVKTGGEDRFHEVPVGHEIGPLTLTLEPCRDCVVTERLLTVAEFREPRITHHEISRDERHLHDRLPVGIQLFPAASGLRGVRIGSFGTVGFGPGQRRLVLVRIVDLEVHATDELAHVHVFVSHPEILLVERFIHGASGDSH